MIKPITSIKPEGRRVLLRTGFDVPLERDRFGMPAPADDTRIKAAIPTIDYLLGSKAKIVIATHLGRPGGKPDPEKSLLPVAKRLAELLGRKLVEVDKRMPAYKTADHVYFSRLIPGPECGKLVGDMRNREIFFLENLRFYPGEEAADKRFAENLAGMADLFVNEAFSVSHRNTASVVGAAKLLPAYAGLGLAAELKALDRVIKQPQPPLVAIMGGAKISDKIDTIDYLAPKASHVLIGGAIANSFLKALGYETGHSLVSEISLAKELLRHYREKLVLPVDVVVAAHRDGLSRACLPDQVKPNEYIFDIGPESVRKYAGIIKTAKTIVWNGPMGLIEQDKFSFGSKALAQAVAARSSGKAYGVVGGGESLEIIARTKVGEYIDHVSTGGGAMLDYLAGKRLPALAALDQ